MANNNTINGKTNKSGLIAFIRDAVQKVTEDTLKSRIDYTLKGVEKDPDGVTKVDLYDLAKDIMSALTPAPVLAPVENSLKPKKKAETAPVADTEEEVEDTADETEDETPAPAPAKKEKKKLNKSKKEVAPAVEATDGLTKKDLPMAKIFPKEINHQSLGKLIACPDKYHTFEEVRKALEEDEKTLIFACYWTKRHIKEFSYAQSYEVPVPKDGFPNDLDTLQALYVCSGIDRIYALSTYTEAMFRFIAEDLAPVECEANDGSKFLMRYSAGLEFEIYEAVEG